MLSGCASSGAATSSSTATDPDPVIEVRYETRTVCPEELTTPLAARPSIPTGAIVEANPEGAAWLAADQGAHEAVRDRFRDAAAQCPAAETPRP